MCFRRIPVEVFLGHGTLKICSKCTVEHPCWSAISVKLLTLRHGCFPVICCIFSEHRFHNNTYGGVLLEFHSELLALTILSSCEQNLTDWTFCKIYQNKFNIVAKLFVLDVCGSPKYTFATILYHYDFPIYH